MSIWNDEKKYVPWMFLLKSALTVIHTTFGVSPKYYKSADEQASWIQYKGPKATHQCVVKNPSRLERTVS